MLFRSQLGQFPSQYAKLVGHVPSGPTEHQLGAFQSPYGKLVDDVSPGSTEHQLGWFPSPYAKLVNEFLPGPPSTSSVLPQNVAPSRLMSAAPRSLQLRVGVSDDSTAAITFRVSDDRSPASPASDDRWSGWERPAGVPEFRLRLM